MNARLASFIAQDSTQGMTLSTVIWVLQHQQSRQSLTDMPTDQPDEDNYSIYILFPGPLKLMVNASYASLEINHRNKPEQSKS